MQSSLRAQRSNPVCHRGGIPDCLAALARTDKSTPACADAAVDRVDHTGRIAGPIRRKERHEVADLVRMRGAAEWQAFLEFLVTVLVTELVLCASLQQRDVT